MSCSLLKTKMKLFALLLCLSATRVKVYPDRYTQPTSLDGHSILKA